jgi:hypothetical protein
MTDRRLRPTSVLRTSLLVAAACTVALLATHALSAQARPAAHAKRAYSAKIVNQDFGSDGAKGSFSAKLGPAANLIARLAGAVTGVPYAEIARGGTFRARIAPSSQAGLALVTFKDRSLGTACVSWSGKSGKYDPSKGFLAVDGSLTVVGGTGAAAHWQGSLRFMQTGLTGRDTLDVNALPVGSTGAAHGLTAACRAVAKLKG